MSTILFILFTFCELNVLQCELLGTPHVLASSLNENESRPFKSSSPDNDLTREKILDDELSEDPLSSINIDYLNNALIVQFRRNDMEMDPRRRSALDKNFMRFGRSDGRMRFGKRQLENVNDQKTMTNRVGERYGRSDNEVTRDSRADNFMRFGRGDGMMRFGRAGDGMLRFGRQSITENPMRFGRSDKKTRNDRNMMRFGRSGYPTDSIDKNNFERFDRMDNFMRFGRDPSYPNHLIETKSDPMMRFGRNDKNFMRFGKLDQNFMRFGKRDNKYDNDKVLNKTLNQDLGHSNSIEHKSKPDELNQYLLNESKLSQQKNLGLSVDDDSNEESNSTNDFFLVPKYLLSQ